MSNTRINMPLATSGGATVGDTGYLTGTLQQFMFVPASTDTGQPATLSLALIPTAAGNDTGGGWAFYSESVANMGVSFRRLPRVATHDNAGAVTDTGNHIGLVTGAGDRLRVKLVPTDTGNVVDGSLYIWSADLG